MERERESRLHRVERTDNKAVATTQKRDFIIEKLNNGNKKESEYQMLITLQ